MSITIIPAAGEGLRFKDANYLDPKPSILVAGNPIIYWSLLGNKKSINPTKTIIAVKKLNLKSISKSVLDSNNKLNFKNLEIISIEKSTSGPAETVAQCLINLGLELDETSPLYCLDSDMLLFFDNQTILWDFFTECYVVAGQSNHPQHCYLTTDKNRVVSISEKEQTSNLAIVGCYIFKSPKIYLDLYKKAKNNLEKNKEFYISNVVKESVSRATCSYVISTEYFSLGTPEELNFSSKHLSIFNSFN